PVRVPPLRERAGDVPMLARHFAARFAHDLGVEPVRFAPNALAALAGYAWPGNVRELMNAVERAVALSDGVVLVEHLPERVRSGARATNDPDGAVLTLEEVERRHVVAVLERTGGNKTRAAELLGIDLSTLYRKLRRYDT